MQIDQDRREQFCRQVLWIHQEAIASWVPIPHGMDLAEPVPLRRNPMRRILCRIALVVLVGLPSQTFADWMYNMDVAQPFATAQNNFEIVLQGDQTLGLLHGVEPWSNPFGAPYSRTTTFNGTNTTIRFAGAGSITNGPGGPYHFGIRQTPGRNAPAILNVYWTPAGSVAGKVPILRNDLTFPPGVGMATGRLRNDTLDEVTFSSLGYRIVDQNSLSLQNLNVTGMPPASFTPIAVADHILSPGESTPSFNIATIDPIDPDAVVLFFQLQFSGASSGNPYTGVTRVWAGNAPLTNVPALNVWGVIALVATLLLTSLWFVRRRMGGSAGPAI
jgi:hypothetical protein